jgi:hypothetical protein
MAIVNVKTATGIDMDRVDAKSPAPTGPVP